MKCLTCNCLSEVFTDKESNKSSYDLSHYMYGRSLHGDIHRYSRRVAVFFRGGGRGVSLLRQANDEMNHFEFGSYPCRLDASRKQILHKYNTNSKFEIKKNSLCPVETLL